MTPLALSGDTKPDEAEQRQEDLMPESSRKEATGRVELDQVPPEGRR